jgi:hypothetical protein
MIFLSGDKAYILTAGASKEEFASYYQEFQKAFRSFTLTPDPIATLPQEKQRETLRCAQKELLQQWEALLTLQQTPETLFADADFQKKHWAPFQELVIQQFSEMGAHWQVQCLKATQDQFLKKHSEPKKENE